MEIGSTLSNLGIDWSPQGTDASHSADTGVVALVSDEGLLSVGAALDSEVPTRALYWYAMVGRDAGRLHTV